MKLYIYLFRHGQTTYNRDKRFTGFNDAKLTKLGINQAKIIAKKLKNKKFSVAFYTGLIRSTQTLKEVLRYHSHIKLIKDNRMIERNYGRLNGHTHKEIIKKYGQEQFEKWHRGFNCRPPGGESFADVERRVRSFIVWLKKFMKKNKVNVVISSHGNSIRLFRKILEHKSEKEAVKWFIPYDKIFSYSLDIGASHK